MPKKRKKLKLPLAYKPLGFALGWASGALAGLAFEAAWKAVRHEEDAPDALRATANSAPWRAAASSTSPQPRSLSSASGASSS
ncbi:DUF4235 domain-containing protein [Streptomyces sp. me109]|nr:DUF4235 domain-containing protein [Streptomyces sp. me109]